jgi:hypothetical protein
LVQIGRVVIDLDETVERRRGARIKARGLRWLSVMLLPEIPWAARIWALPYLTVLAPSERYARKHRQRHKKLSDWGPPTHATGAMLLPERQIVAVTDSCFAAIDLLNAVRNRICMITRLHLDARLFDPPIHTAEPAKSVAPRVVGRLSQRRLRVSPIPGRAGGASR